MKDQKLKNIPVMSVGKAVKALSDAYTAIINQGIPIKTFPSVMLWGAPGIGKSQGVRQMAKMIEGETGKKTVITDVRLLLFNPIDLRGIPTANADKTLAIWLKPQIFQMDESDDIINILFLDEISSAPQSVQAAAYQIALDRVVGEHRLPENCIVIAAGNRVTDKSVAFKMPKALANRLLHIEIKSDFDSWENWAIKNGINLKIIGFLSFKRDCLLQDDASADQLAFATPRTWEMVSNILNFVKDDAEKEFDLISGLVGSGMAHEFRTWCKVYKELPDIDDIFSGKAETVPKETDAMYALISAMTEYARAHKEDSAGIANSIRYAEKLPPDYSAVLMKNYMCLDDGYKNFLMRIPEFTKWMQTKGRYINAAF